MESKQYVKSISISDETRDRVLFEGVLGDIKKISLIEGEALEIRGDYGVLRIELNEEDLRKALAGSKARSA